MLQKIHKGRWKTKKKGKNYRDRGFFCWREKKTKSEFFAGRISVCGNNRERNWHELFVVRGLIRQINSYLFFYKLFLIVEIFACTFHFPSRRETIPKEEILLHHSQIRHLSLLISLSVSPCTATLLNPSNTLLF